MKILKFVLLFVFANGLISCGGGDDKKVDTTKPTIKLNGPLSTVMINPGGIINVNAVLSDNVKLDDYVVKISYRGFKSVKNVEEFYFSSYADLDAYGNALPVIKGESSFDLNFDIAVGETTRVGDYIFSITLTDESGNSTEEMVQFEISRS
ncbi:DUF4625 domain-containing protein [Ancylomarina sp.]|uniref:DUF4625 domain-containing protein n=1 Tax=Ancylomarina sp. TaxID=1970196 RepID=UPI0035650BE4